MLGAGYLAGIVLALVSVSGRWGPRPALVVGDGAGRRLSLAIDPCVDVDSEQVRRLLILELDDEGGSSGDPGQGLIIAVGCESRAQVLRVADSSGKPAARRSINLRAIGKSGRDARSRELALAVAELVRRRGVIAEEKASAGAAPVVSVAPAPAPKAGGPASRSEPGPPPIGADPLAIVPAAPDPLPLPPSSSVATGTPPVAVEVARPPTLAGAAERGPQGGTGARVDAEAFVPSAPRSWALQVGFVGAFDAYGGGKQDAGADLLIRGLLPRALVLQARLGGRRMTSAQLPRGRLDSAGWLAEIAGGFVLIGEGSRLSVSVLAHLQMQALSFTAMSDVGTRGQNSTLTAVVAGVGPSASLALGHRLTLVAALGVGGVVHGVTVRVQGTPIDSVTGTAVSGALGVVAQF